MPDSPRLPSGFVTFLFLGISGNAPEMLARPFLESAAREVEAAGGVVFKEENGVLFSVFQQARSAVAAAGAACKRKESGAPNVFGVIHSGEAAPGGEDYAGRQVDLAAGLLELAKPGRILLSLVTRTLVRDNLKDLFFVRDLGIHPLLEGREFIRVFELISPDLPGAPFLIRTGKGHAELPAQQLTSFVGRKGEVETVKELLAQSRLLTLVGPGGIGKTRLALQTAAEVAREFPGGAWLIDFSSLSFPELVVQTVASVLGVRELAGEPLVEILLASLKSRKILLVFDNCEHLHTAVSGLCRLILDRSEEARILVTSRQPLDLPLEKTWRVSPIQVPEAENLSETAKPWENESIKLFLDRVPPSPFRFNLSPRSLSQIEKICRKLEGIPLAIELAAARAGDMTLDEISARIEENVRMLSARGKSVTARHETLREAIDWSYNLLTEKEQVLFRRLSVFSGGFQAESAIDVCAGEAEILSGLSAKSLVSVAETPGEEPRYSILEILRQYAAEKLDDSKETAGLLEKHAEYYLAWIEKIHPRLLGADQAKLLTRIESEHGNLRKALAWFKRNPGVIDKGVQLSGALMRFWLLRGYVSEGADNLERTLSHSSPQATKHRARALLGAGILATEQGDYRKAEGFAREGLRISREIGFKPGIAKILNLLGILLGHGGKYDEACSYLKESLIAMKETNDKPGTAAVLLNLGAFTGASGNYEAGKMFLEESIAVCREAEAYSVMATGLTDLGINAWYRGDYKTARALQEEGLALSRRLGYKRITASALHNLALIVTDEAQYSEALSYLRESLLLDEELMNKEQLVWCFVGFARLASAAGDPAKSAELFGVANSLAGAIGLVLSHYLMEDYERHAKNLKEKMGETAFLAAYEKGEKMSLIEAIALGKDFEIAKHAP